MEKSILEMLLELTSLVCDFNAASDNKGVEKSFSIQINNKTFAVCIWDESGEKQKITHSAYGGISIEFSKNPKKDIQQAIDLISHETQSMKSKGE